MFEELGLGIKLTFDTGDAEKKMALLGASQRKMKEGFSDIRSGANEVMMSLAAFGAVATGAAALSVREYAKLETGLAKIGTLLPGGVSEAKQMTGALEEMSMKFGASIGEISEGTFQAISANVGTGQKALDFVSVAQKAATAGFTTTATAVDGLTNVINAYGVDSSEAMRIADEMFLANQYGKTTFEELSRSIGQVAPTAALAGVGSDQLFAAIAAMTNQGIDTSMSVVSLNQAMLAYISPSKEAATAAKQFGIELTPTTLRTKGLAGALAEVQEKVGGNEEALANIFGNVRSFRAAAVLAGTGAEFFNMTLGKMHTELGITDRNFKDVSGTLSFQFGRVVETARVLVGKLGGALVEEFGIGSAAGGAADWLAKRVDGITEAARGMFRFLKRGFDQLGLSDRFDRATAAAARLGQTMEGMGKDTGPLGDMKAKFAALGVLGVVLSPLAFLLKPIFGLFGGLFKMGGGLAKVLQGLGGTFRGLTGALMGGVKVIPVIGWIITGITLLVQAIRQNAGGLRDILLSVGADFAELWRNGISPFISAVSNYLGPIISTLLIPVGAALGSVLKIVSSALVALLGPVFRLASAVIGLVGKALLPGLTVLSRLLTLVVVGFKGGWDNIMTHGFGRIGGVIDALATGINWVTNLLDGLLRKLDALFGISARFPQLREAFGTPAAPDTSGPFGGLPATGPGALDKNMIHDQWLKEAEDRQAAEVLEAMTGEKAQAVGTSIFQYTQAMEDTRKDEGEANVNVAVNIDGRKVAKATAKVGLDITERSGSDITPYQRRAIIEKGAWPRMA